MVIGNRWTCTTGLYAMMVIGKGKENKVEIPTLLLKRVAWLNINFIIFPIISRSNTFQ